MKLKILFIVLMFSSFSWGQISIPSTTTINENFDSMSNSATAALPANWKFSVAGAAAPTWAAALNFTAVNNQASSGTPATGARYNWGTTAATDRALGIMTSAGYASPNSIMAYYRNTNVASLTQLNITYNLERYRINTAAASVQFYYSTDGSTWTSITAGDVAAASLPTGASAYNFTPGLTIPVSFSITGLTISSNSDIYLRWNLNTTGSNSQGIGIDDVGVTATFSGCTPPSDPPAGAIISGTTPACTNTTLSCSATVSAPIFYYWQTSATGTSTTNNAATPLVVSATNTYWVRTYNSSTTCWSTNSNATSYPVTINAPVTITTQPSNQSATVGASATFTVIATGTGLFYQWEFSTNGGTTWTPVGVSSASYTTPATVIGDSGTLYHVIMSGTSPCNPVTSASATLYVCALTGALVAGTYAIPSACFLTVAD